MGKDTDLITSAKLNHSTYHELYQKYHQKVYNYFWYRLGYDKEISDDLTQETFLRAFNKLDQYKDKGYSYLTYLLRIAHNIIVNYYRDHKVETNIDNIGDIPVKIKKHLEDGMDDASVWLEVEKLPLIEKDLILLRYHRDLEIEEIAKIIGKSKNAVQLILTHARKRLKQNMDQVKFEC